ncbi:putative F-box protein [Platanthera zijinensis]|uniref:F-box protein n=1 Tax=Platanthera zijinensis TaxID=2320716 RepID=A0AAP0BKZ3_9ASPA
MKKTGKRKRAVMMKTAETKKKMFLRKNKKKKTPLANSQPMAREKYGFYIPVDIVSEILLNLPARSLGKFRCVSKSWLSITSNTAFIRANAQRNPHSLIIEGMNRSGRYCLASAEAISESSIRLREYLPLQFSSDYSLAQASCDGLICRYHKIRPCVINPLTGQSVPLPRDGDELNCKLGFYFHHSTSKYRLIRFTDTMHESEVLVVGEHSWRRIPGSLPAFFYLPYPLDLNGNIYWLAHSLNEDTSEVPPDTVVIFDEEKEVYSVISLPPLEKLHDLEAHLLDFNGKLGLWVARKNNTIDVWIMENVWIKRHSINYAQIHACPSQFNPRWRASVYGAVTIGDEELLIKLSKCRASECKAPHYIVRCNLKSGACVVRNLMGLSHLSFSTFPYTETLANPQSPAST